MRQRRSRAIRIDASRAIRIDASPLTAAQVEAMSRQGLLQRRREMDWLRLPQLGMVDR